MSEDMKIDKLLTVVGFAKGVTDKKYQYYQIILTDNEELFYAATVGCKLYRTESCNNTFTKLGLIPAPKSEEKEEKANEHKVV